MRKITGLADQKNACAPDDAATIEIPPNGLDCHAKGIPDPRKTKNPDRSALAKNHEWPAVSHSPILTPRPPSALIQALRPLQAVTLKARTRPVSHKLNEVTLQIIDVQHSCNGKVVLA
jgi:hypothetical protein